MKLRHRLALVFALSTSLMLLFSRTGLIFSFMHVQWREFDALLDERAKFGATEVARLGRKALDRSAGVRSPEAVEHTITYGALYDERGALLWNAPTFMGAPTLSALDVWKSGRPSTACFDLAYGGDQLRAVVKEIDAPETEPAARFLLMAVSRHEIDNDARQLRDLGVVVLFASIGASLVLGWLIGKRMTRGVEAMASAARRVTAGDLDVRIELAVVRDTEVAALAEALRQMLDRLRGLIEHERRFASNAAHELRSPLTALRGELELALRRPRTAADYEQTLRRVLDDANTLIALSEDLLVFARASVVHAHGKRGAVKVEELVTGAVAAAAVRGERASSIATDVRAVGDVVVVGDKSELVRVLRNLIDNAIAHAPEGATVRVVAREATGVAGRSVRIEVEDDGPGVPLEVRDRIFEPFVRGDADRERSGAGLGLAIAREVARRYGGDVLLDSASAPTRFALCVGVAGAVVDEG